MAKKPSRRRSTGSNQTGGNIVEVVGTSDAGYDAANDITTDTETPSPAEVSSAEANVSTESTETGGSQSSAEDTKPVNPPAPSVESEVVSPSPVQPEAIEQENVVVELVKPTVATAANINNPTDLNINNSKEMQTKRVADLKTQFDFFEKVKMCNDDRTKLDALPPEDRAAISPILQSWGKDGANEPPNPFKDYNRKIRLATQGLSVIQRIKAKGQLLLDEDMAKILEELGSPKYNPANFLYVPESTSTQSEVNKEGKEGPKVEKPTVSQSASTPPNGNGVNTGTTTTRPTPEQGGVQSTDNISNLLTESIGNFRKTTAMLMADIRGKHEYQKVLDLYKMNYENAQGLADQFKNGGDFFKELKATQDALKKVDINSINLTNIKRTEYLEALKIFKDMDLDALRHGMLHNREELMTLPIGSAESMGDISRAMRVLMDQAPSDPEASTKRKYDTSDIPDIERGFRELDEGINETARRLVEETGVDPENVEKKGEIVYPGLLSALGAAFASRVSGNSKKQKEAMRALQFKFNANGSVMSNVHAVKESSLDIARTVSSVNELTKNVQGKLDTMPSYKQYLNRSTELQMKKFNGDKEKFDREFFNPSSQDQDIISLRQSRDKILDDSPEVASGLTKIRKNLIKLQDHTQRFSNSSSELCNDRDVSDRARMGVSSITREVSENIAGMKLPEGIEPKESTSRLSIFKRKVVEAFQSIIDGIKRMFSLGSRGPAPSGP